MASLAECLEQVVGEAPPAGDASASEEPSDATDWLAARGLGLAPVPPDFGWPGRFLGRWPSGEWCVLFGVPAGVVFGSVEGDGVAEAYVVAPHQPVPRVVSAPVAGGRVEGVFLAPAAEAPMVSADAVPVVAGRGLEGDRYFDGAGTFSEKGGTGREITFADAAALEAAGVAPLECRRNVVVSGVDLDGLIGRSFRVGELECIGRRRCEPCAHLQRLTRPGVLRALVHRGGLRADVVRGGTLRVGDAISVV